jgi:hypothetical protein
MVVCGREHKKYQYIDSFFGRARLLDLVIAKFYASPKPSPSQLKYGGYWEKVHLVV